ncbi:MAG: biotin transporter BioY [Coriobacteriia bacterium]|nr:biotin transporter BioY [Coriobacteriia bacterium]
MRTRTVGILRSALVAALIAVGALIAIPIGPVPVTLQVLVVAVAALVLLPAEALSALVLYIALGAVGAPVFSGGGAGVGYLLGPTGGFILGFALGAPLAALARRLVAGERGHTPGRRTCSLRADVVALLVLLTVTYGLGWAYFAVSTGRAAAEAFAIAVAPFILIDAGKCAAAVAVARAVRSAGAAAP